jgi:hypothetical protein
MKSLSIESDASHPGDAGDVREAIGTAAQETNASVTT